MAIERIVDHATRALAFVLSQFTDATNIRKLVRIAAGSVQDAEDAAFSLAVDRLLTTAEGAQLDQYGKIVGAPRNGLIDADYSRVLQARIKANRSNGQPDQITGVVSLLLSLSPIVYKWRGTAHYSLLWQVEQATPDDWAATVRGFVEDMTPAGVSFEATEGVAGAFRFDSGPGFDAGKLARRVLV